MKAFVLALLLCAQSAIGAVIKNITLSWGFPVAELTTNISFNVYSTTNIILPLPLWPLVTNVSGLKSNVTIPIHPGITFYCVTATNRMGESSPFSNVVSEQVPRSGTLQIQPGP